MCTQIGNLLLITWLALKSVMQKHHANVKPWSASGLIELLLSKRRCHHVELNYEFVVFVQDEADHEQLQQPLRCCGEPMLWLGRSSEVNWVSQMHVWFGWLMVFEGVRGRECCLCVLDLDGWQLVFEGVRVLSERSCCVQRQSLPTMIKSCSQFEPLPRRGCGPAGSEDKDKGRYSMSQFQSWLAKGPSSKMRKNGRQARGACDSTWQLPTNNLVSFPVGPIAPFARNLIDATAAGAQSDLSVRCGR